jgi:hypothetical protein
MEFGADIGEVPSVARAVCAQPVAWTGDAWEHEVTGLWANVPVRHRASPTPPARAATSGGQECERPRREYEPQSGRP